LQGDYLREKISWGISLSKWVTTTGPSKGLRASLGFRVEEFDHTFLRGDPNLFSDLTVNSIVLGLEDIEVEDRGLYRSGRHYGLRTEFANGVLGSDVTHTSHNIYYRRYKPLDPKTRTNLNLQVQIGTISESVFGDPTFSITGGSTVRGYARDSIEGNTFYYVESVSDITLTDPKFGIGVGLRWKIRSFVRTDLRVDIAQGLGDEGETRVYAGTRATF